MPRGHHKFIFVAVTFTCLSFVSLKLSSSYYTADARVVYEIHQQDVGQHLHTFNVLTYSDRVTPGLCRSMATAAFQGFELSVLGVDEVSFTGFSGDPKMKKLLGMKALFQNNTLQSQFGLRDDSVLIFADAGDVLYLGGLDEVEKSWNALIATHGDDFVLVAAERNCWPYMVKTQERIAGGAMQCNDFPDLNSTFHYVNSGAYMGKLKAVENLVAAAYSRATGDDQLSLHEVYAEYMNEGNISGQGQKPGLKMGLDSTASVFQTGWGTNLESGIKYTQHESQGAYYDQQSRRVINTEHGTKPFLVHFNGGKSALQPLASSVLVAESSITLNRERINEVLSTYRAKHSWYTESCEQIDEVALLHQIAQNTEASIESHTEANEQSLNLSSMFSVCPPGVPIDKNADESQISAFSKTLQNAFREPCPPGYPELPGISKPCPQNCALQFFKNSLQDMHNFSSDGPVIISVKQMQQIVQKWPQRLGLFQLLKHNGDDNASWEHVTGQGKSFWSTKPFHDFMSRHASRFSQGLTAGQRAYFVVNGFDEPAVLGNCPNLSGSAKLHPNVREGLIDAKEGVPVWSMSKVRGCHNDLLIPHPDIFAKLDHKANTSSNPHWAARADKVAFRGSTTGMGNATSNLRIRASRELFNNSDFDVGIHAAIQTIQEDSIRDLMKPRMSTMKLSSFRYAMDIDGNAHSFNRPLAIARAGCTLLRVNVFTDLFDDGLLSDIHAFDINPARIGVEAPKVLEKLRETPEKAQSAATQLAMVHEWLTEDVLIAYMQVMIAQYVMAIQFSN